MICLVFPMKRAVPMLRDNILGLLRDQHESQVALAEWVGHKKAWLNKFLNGHREIQIEDLDRIADFFHVELYQLFQPGISSRTERRSGRDRRAGRERRQGRQVRHMLAVGEEIAAHRPGAPRSTPSAEPPPVLPGELVAALQTMRKDLDAILVGEQTAASSRAVAAARPRRRAARRPDPGQVDKPK